MNRNRLIVVAILAIIILLVVGIFLFKGGGAKSPGAVTHPASTSTGAQTMPLGISVSSSSGISAVFSTTTVGVYKGGSFSFVYPPSWRIFSINPFAMDDFGGQYENGGIIPQRGAELDIVTTTIGGPLENIMKTELMSATDLTTSTVSVGGVSCDEAEYQDTYTPDFTSQDISIYCLRGNSLWKIYFSNRTGDPARKTELSDLNMVLGSMKLLP